MKFCHSYKRKIKNSSAQGKITSPKETETNATEKNYKKLVKDRHELVDKNAALGFIDFFATN